MPTIIKPVDTIQLKPRQDTWAKLSTAQASALTSDEKVLLKSGQPFDVYADYEPAGDGHMLVRPLVETAIGNELYIYCPDFPECPQVLRVDGTTKLVHSSGETTKVWPGSFLQLDYFIQAQPEEGKNFATLGFSHPFNGHQVWQIYYGELEKCTVFGTEKDNRPIDMPAKAAPPDGKIIKVPGFVCPNTNLWKTEINLAANILIGGHFTWNEATKNGSRIPVGTAVMNGILQISQKLEIVRSKFGDKKVKVNSWYRDPVTNRRVGGAKYSRHLSGDAVDFDIEGVHPYTVYDRLDSWHGRSGGLASSTIFTHLDLRPGNEKSRWSYGF